MSGLLVPSLLLVLGLAIIGLELFLPSGGVLGVMAALAIVAAILLAFRDAGATSGTLFLAMTSIIVPLVIVRLLRWWPHTPLGRRILNQPLPAAERVPNRTDLQQLIGRCGVTKSKMLPSGAVVIDSKTYDALTEGMPLELGQPIRVVAFRAGGLVVRPSSHAELQADRELRDPRRRLVPEDPVALPTALPEAEAGVSAEADAPATKSPNVGAKTGVTREQASPTDTTKDAADAIPDPFAE